MLPHHTKPFLPTLCPLPRRHPLPLLRDVKGIPVHSHLYIPPSTSDRLTPLHHTKPCLPTSPPSLAALTHPPHSTPSLNPLNRFPHPTPPPGDVKGILELSIAATGERNTYTLVGRAAEPVAEGQITIECQARKPAVKQFNVPNIVGTGTEYKVRTWGAGRAACGVEVMAPGGQCARQSRTHLACGWQYLSDHMRPRSLSRLPDVRLRTGVRSPQPGVHVHVIAACALPYDRTTVPCPAF